MKTKVERVFTVEIQATQDVDGRIWQALRPAENCTLDKAGSANDAWYVAKEVAFTQMHSPASPQAIDVLAQQEWVAVVSDVANRTRPASAEDTLVALGHLIAQIAEARFRITRLLEGK